MKNPAPGLATLKASHPNLVTDGKFVYYAAETDTHVFCYKIKRAGAWEDSSLAYQPDSLFDYGRANETLIGSAHVIRIPWGPETKEYVVHGNDEATLVIEKPKAKEKVVKAPKVANIGGWYYKQIETPHGKKWVAATRPEYLTEALGSYIQKDKKADFEQMLRERPATNEDQRMEDENAGISRKGNPGGSNFEIHSFLVNKRGARARMRGDGAGEVTYILPDGRIVLVDGNTWELDGARGQGYRSLLIEIERIATEEKMRGYSRAEEEKLAEKKQKEDYQKWLFSWWSYLGAGYEKATGSDANIKFESSTWTDLNGARAAFGWFEPKNPLRIVVNGKEFTSFAGAIKQMKKYGEFEEPSLPKPPATFKEPSRKGNPATRYKHTDSAGSDWDLALYEGSYNSRNEMQLSGNADNYDKSFKAVAQETGKKTKLYDVYVETEGKYSGPMGGGGVQAFTHGKNWIARGLSKSAAKALLYQTAKETLGFARKGNPDYKSMDGASLHKAESDLRHEMHHADPPPSEAREFEILAELRKIAAARKGHLPKAAKPKREKKTKDRYMTVMGGYVLDMGQHGKLVGTRTDSGGVRFNDPTFADLPDVRKKNPELVPIGQKDRLTRLADGKAFEVLAVDLSANNSREYALIPYDTHSASVPVSKVPGSAIAKYFMHTDGSPLVLYTDAVWKKVGTVGAQPKRR